MKPDRTKYLVPDEFRRLLAVAKAQGQEALRERNHMLLALAGNLGLRVSEVVSLRIDSFHFEMPSRPYVRLRTAKQKRPVENDLGLDEKLARAVRSYVTTLGAHAIKRYRLDAKAVRARRSELCLFPGAVSPWQPMTTRSAQLVFKEAARLAGLDARVSFHALRHYRGSQVWTQTKDPLAVQRLLRHSSMSSGGVYVHMDEDEERKINARVGSIL